MRLTGLLLMACSDCCLKQSRTTYLPRGSTLPPGPSHISQGVAGGLVSAGQSDGGVFLIVVPSSQLILACVKFTKARQHQGAS